MPSRVRVDGEEWALVDELELRNRESEDRHAFRIEGTRRSFRERETQRYPGGSGIEGRGHRHQGGEALFRVGNLMPGAPLVMVRQCWAQGSEHGKVRVDGRPIGSIQETEVDARSPWRNRAFVVPADVVQREELPFEVLDSGSDRGLTWFHVWFYQPAAEADALARASAVAAGGGGLVQGGAAAYVPGSVAVVSGARTFKSWSLLRDMGRDLPLEMVVEGRPWRLADSFAFSDQAAVEHHGFRVVDSQGTYAGFKLGLRFPDGNSCQEQGIRYEHGESTWEASGLTRGKDVVLVIRTDVQHGPCGFDLSADGNPVGRIRVDVRDPVHRGRNWDVPVPGRFVGGPTVRFRAAVGEPGQPVTMFRIWVFQVT